MVELQVATYLFLKTVASLPEKFEDRHLIYSSQSPLEITISGAMLNALHECEHHLGDARRTFDCSRPPIDRPDVCGALFALSEDNRPRPRIATLNAVGRSRVTKSGR